jgi:hypothetical protein
LRRQKYQCANFTDNNALEGLPELARLKQGTLPTVSAAVIVASFRVNETGVIGALTQMWQEAVCVCVGRITNRTINLKMATKIFAET